MPVEVDGKKSRKRGRKKGSREKLLAVAAWLRAFLAAGPRRASEAVALGERAGFSEPTLERAKREIGARSTYRWVADGGRFWIWTASDPADASECAQRKSKTRDFLITLDRGFGGSRWCASGNSDN